MKIKRIQELKISGVKLITYQHFPDTRGYFTESYNFTEFENFDLFDTSKIVQINESFSLQNVIRGLHFQWNPFMGKLVRTVSGHMVDLVLDLRPASITFKKILAVDMPSGVEKNENTWIWVPPGFAHGNFFTEPTRIEYLCTGEYNKDCETGVNPFSEDIDWSLCDATTKKMFDNMRSDFIISDKDVALGNIDSWRQSENGSIFNSLLC